MTPRTADDHRSPWARRRLRLTAVAGAVTGPAAIWILTVPILDHRLQVAKQNGEPPLDIGLAIVIIFALGAAVMGWGLLAILERLTRRARRLWTITATLVLIASFLPLTGPGTPAATRAVLGLMHVAVAAALVPILLRTVVQHSTTETRSSQPQ